MAKGGAELLQDPVAQELLASRIPARLAYVWTDGTPRVVSIWFHWDGTDLVMGTLPGAPKLKALHTGDRVAITIDTNDPPHHVLSIRGTAEVTETAGDRGPVGTGAVWGRGHSRRCDLGLCARVDRLAVEGREGSDMRTSQAAADWSNSEASIVVNLRWWQPLVGRAPRDVPGVSLCPSELRAYGSDQPAPGWVSG
jgi:hypothetical protein